MAACVGEYTTRAMHSPNDNPPEPKLAHPLVWHEGGLTQRVDKTRVPLKLQGHQDMWRHDGRVWRQLTAEGAALMQRLARNQLQRRIPVATVLPDASLAHEGDLCLLVERRPLLEFDGRRLATVPETSHHYVDPLPRQLERERLLREGLLQLAARFARSR